MSYESVNVNRAADIVRGWKAMGCRVVVASGYFNPLHQGHVRYLKAAKRLGDRLVVVVNNDYQVWQKGAVGFMDHNARLEVVGAIGVVDLTVLSVDVDRTIVNTLFLLRPDIFANGGDVGSEADCREAPVCRNLNIQMVFGVGGTEKVASSSDLIRRVSQP